MTASNRGRSRPDGVTICWTSNANSPSAGCDIRRVAFSSDPGPSTSKIRLIACGAARAADSRRPGNRWRRPPAARAGSQAGRALQAGREIARRRASASRRPADRTRSANRPARPQTSLATTIRRRPRRPPHKLVPEIDGARPSRRTCSFPGMGVLQNALWMDTARQPPLETRRNSVRVREPPGTVPSCGVCAANPPRRTLPRRFSDRQ